MTTNVSLPRIHSEIVLRKYPYGSEVMDGFGRVQVRSSDLCADALLDKPWQLQTRVATDLG